MNAPISTYSSCVPCPVHGCASHGGTPTVKGVVPLSQPLGTGKPGGNWRGTEFPEHRLFEILMLAAQDLYRRKDNTGHNPRAIVARSDLHIQLATIEEFDPTSSYASVIVTAPSQQIVAIQSYRRGSPSLL